MKQLHAIQLQILKKALFAPDLRYTDLKPFEELENNQFDFHLDQLIQSGLVEKSGKSYKLSNKGKEYANRMDTDEGVIAQQAKISVIIACTRKVKGQTEYLLYTRLKQPFYGCQGFLSGKVKFGEKVEEAARRELAEETGLKGKPTLVNIKHYLVVDKKSGDLLEDKFMYMHLFKNPKGKLIPNDEGRFEWVNEKDLKDYVTNHFENFSAFSKQVQLVRNFRNQIKFEEVVFRSNKF